MRNGPIIKPARGVWLENYRRHLLEREYMSGVERDYARIKATAEVFTPDDMVKILVKRVGMEIIRDPEKRIIDPTCGDGQFLAYILYCRLKAEIPLLTALKTLYGVEHEPDNVKMCRKRLCCGQEDSKRVMEIVSRNIVEGDTLSYHMRFDGSRAKKKEKQETFGF